MVGFDLEDEVAMGAGHSFLDQMLFLLVEEGHGNLCMRFYMRVAQLQCFYIQLCVSVDWSVLGGYWILISFCCLRNIIVLRPLIDQLKSGSSSLYAT